MCVWEGEEGATPKVLKFFSRHVCVHDVYVYMMCMCVLNVLAVHIYTPQGYTHHKNYIFPHIN